MTTGTRRHTMACGGTARCAAMLVLAAAGIAAPVADRRAAARDRDRRDGVDMSGDTWTGTCRVHLDALVLLLRRAHAAAAPLPQ